MFVGGCVYVVFSLLFNGPKKPKPASGSIWVKRITPSTKVVVTSMSPKGVEYYYSHVNGNQVHSYKMYKESMSKFQRDFRKQ